MVTVYDVLRSDAFLFSAERDGHTVLIRSADKEDVAATESQVARIDVGRQVNAGKVPYMHRSVSVGQRGGDQGAFEWMF